MDRPDSVEVLRFLKLAVVEGGKAAEVTPTPIDDRALEVAADIVSNEHALTGIRFCMLLAEYVQAGDKITPRLLLRIAKEAA